MWCFCPATHIYPHVFCRRWPAPSWSTEIQSRLSTGKVMRAWEQQRTHFPHRWNYGRNGTHRSAEILPEEGSCLSTTINFRFTAKANQTRLIVPKYPIQISIARVQKITMIEIIPCTLLLRLHSTHGQKALSGYSQMTIIGRLPHFSSDWNPVTKAGWLYSNESCTEAYCHLKNPNDHIKVSKTLFRYVRETEAPMK